MKQFIQKFKGSILDLLKGMCIGVACIVPGVSGGTLAVILNIYDRLIEAIGNVTKHFKQSMKTLIPVAIGAICGVVALVFPLKFAIEYIPLPIVSLFVGFIIGGLPGLTDKIKKKPTLPGVFSAILALVFIVGICFIPTGSDFNVATMDWTGYLIFFLVGIVGSTALVVPGISGSMLLLILGFWEPILNVAAELMHFDNVGQNILILGAFAVGCLLGFVLISKLMHFLLERFEYATFMAIIAFIVGSIFSIYYTLEEPFTSTLPVYGHILLSIGLLAIGIVASLFITINGKKRKAKALEESKNQEETTEEAIND